jgi:uncharacterized membrane protein HdeD (DUF308 family)
MDRIIFIVFGIALVLLGSVCITFSFATTIASVAVLGLFLIIKSALLFGKLATHCICKKVVRDTKCFYLSIFLTAVLSLLLGLITITHPFLGAVELTLLFGIFLVSSGTFKMAYAPSVFNGLVTIAFGIMIFHWC